MHFVPFTVATLFGFAFAAPLPAGLDIRQGKVSLFTTGSMQPGLGVSLPMDFPSLFSTDPSPRAPNAEADILLPPLERKEFNSGIVSDITPVALNKRVLNTGQINAIPAAPIAPAPAAVPAANYVLLPPGL